jgi:periplasmic protein TonB
MSATTVNAFPPLHAFNSSRAWFLALIALLHLGFFWALTHGVTIGDLKIDRKMVVDFLPLAPEAPPPQRVIEVNPNVSRVWVPDLEVPNFDPVEETNAPRQVTNEAPPPREAVREAPGAGPVIVEPMVDPRLGLSEPEYPVSEIRQQHEGTVWLAVEILPNGRVGQVRVDQSSGYVRLDESAAREARRWRMKPGMKDGVATAMWKRVPITFQLKD